MKNEQQELISLEILTFKTDVSDMNEDEIKNEYRKYKEKFYLFNDLSQPYIIRTVVGDHSEIRSLEPDLVPECDRYEISESIQDILKENKLPVYKSDFDQNAIENIALIKEKQLNEAIKSEMLKGLKALQDGTLNEQAKNIDPSNISDNIILENIEQVQKTKISVIDNKSNKTG